MSKRVDSTKGVTSKTVSIAATLIGVCILMLVMAAPAMAGKPGKASLQLSGMSEIGDIMRELPDLTETDDDHLDFGLIGPIEMVPLNPIGDGGDWEPVFPEDETPGDAGDEETVPDDCTPDDGADQPEQPEQPADDEADEPEQPADQPEQPADDGADEAADEPEQQADDEITQPEQPSQEQASDEQPTLAFTGGDNTPYLIAGAAIVLFGLLALRRRREDSERD